MAQPAAFALSGGDPRLEAEDEKVLDVLAEKYGHEKGLNYVKPQFRKLHDKNVPFEEYHYYAQRTREEQDRDKYENSTSSGIMGLVNVIFPTKGSATSAAERSGSVVAHNINLGDPEKRATISDEEWANASRALRTASGSAIFYLITTDILGPFGLPYAFASMGWGPGAALFTVFAALAGYSGYLLWDCFIGLDSFEFPLRSYGDMGYRLMGNWARVLFNLLQAIQLILNVGLIVISNGEALSQAVRFKLCFAICCLVWAIAGFGFGQVRTLQKFGWLANAAVFINIGVMVVSMIGSYEDGPNYAGAGLSAGYGLNPASVTANAQGQYPAISHYANLPPAPSFAGSINGAMQAVFSYGGAMIFPEFMAEMRCPKRDFLKGMWAAQAFIYVVYMVYGLFIYYYQGQYVINPSYLGVSGYTLQTVGNVLAMVSAIIAAALYGNIGVKVLYNNIFVEWFKAPPLTTKAGKFFWVALIPIYWSIAFVIAAGIPDFSGLTGVVAAVCILNFTYTFPPLMAVVYYIKKNALRDNEGFDPATGQVIRYDSGMKRVFRGFMAKRWWLNTFNIIYMLGALALAGLGAYGAIENLIAAFASGAINSYTCRSPLDG